MFQFDYRTNQTIIDDQISTANTWATGKTVNNLDIDDEYACVNFNTNTPANQVLFGAKIIFVNGFPDDTLIGELETELTGRNVEYWRFIEKTVIYAYT
jgi:hypothetical protein